MELYLANQLRFFTDGLTCFILYNYSVWTCSGRFLMLLLDVREDAPPTCS